MAAEAIYGARWAVEDGANASFNSSSVRWDFKRGDTLRYRRPRLRTPALRGTRSRIAAQTRIGDAVVAGSLSIDPSPKFLGWALPRVMGGGSETVPAFADAIPEFSLLADRGTVTSTNYGDCLKYTGCKLAALTVTCRGGLIDCVIDIIAKSRSQLQTFAGAALGTTAAYSPYQMADVTFTGGNTGSQVYPLKEWQLTISNGLTARYTTGSATATDILEGDRVVEFSGISTVAADAINFGILDNTDHAATLSIVNSTLSTVFTMPNLQVDEDDLIGDDVEFIVPLSCTLTGTTATEMTVANDVTP